MPIPAGVDEETRRAAAELLRSAPQYCASCGAVILWGREAGYCWARCVMTLQRRWRRHPAPEVGVFSCPDHGIVVLAGWRPGAPCAACPVRIEPTRLTGLRMHRYCGRYAARVP